MRKERYSFCGQFSWVGKRGFFQVIELGQKEGTDRGEKPGAGLQERDAE